MVDFAEQEGDHQPAYDMLYGEFTRNGLSNDNASEWAMQIADETFG